MIPLIENQYSLLQAPSIDRNDILIIDVIKVDEQILGKLDTVAIEYYGDENALPIILDWNGITSVQDIHIGQFMELPDIKTMFSGYDTNPILINDIHNSSANGIPGVVDVKQSTMVLSDKVDIKKEDTKISDLRRSLISKSTTANTKLNISKQSATYNPDTGELIF